MTTCIGRFAESKGISAFAGGEIQRAQTVNSEEIEAFVKELRLEEKSEATIEKYLRTAMRFKDYLAGRPLTRDAAVAYKELLMKEYADRTVNAMLVGFNRFVEFIGRWDCKVKNLKLQRQVYCREERHLDKKEYLQLLCAAEDNPELELIMETLCGTGIRVSELQFFTKEAVQDGIVHIRLKGKGREVLLCGALRRKLLAYCKVRKIRSGVIFRGRKGTPLDRSVIWAKMKRLCKKAKVMATKVFPHNLRKLFAQCYYKKGSDIARLADLLGHSSVDTTRIYLMETGAEHRKQIENLGLILSEKCILGNAIR